MEEKENKGGNWWDSEDLNRIAPIVGSGTALLTIGYTLYIGYSKNQDRKEKMRLENQTIQDTGKIGMNQGKLLIWNDKVKV